MALLGVIAIDLLAGFADLLDHDVHALALDDTLDPRVFVSRNEQKPVALPSHTVVHRGRNLDRSETRRAPAFAVKRQRRLYPVLLCAVLDALVDTAKDLFVTSGAICKLHPRIVAQPAPTPPVPSVSVEALPPFVREIHSREVEQYQEVSPCSAEMQK